MKKILSAALIIIMSLCLLCGCESQPEPIEDVKYVQDKGTLTVGVTDMPSLNYKDGTVWEGFDADLARLFAEHLGVEIEFKEILWDNKVIELSDKNIDCVLNGLTVIKAVEKGMTVSDGYVNNPQAVVVGKENADKYKTLKKIEDLKFAVEGGSAAEDVVKEEKLDYLVVESQADALREVYLGSADACIIDKLVADSVTENMGRYPDLARTVVFDDDAAVAGFRRGSDLAEEFNGFIDELIDNGKLASLADEYGISESELIK